MNSLTKKLLWLVLLWPILGFAESMTELDYLDHDPGTAAYPTRILVNKNFMRMDSGKDADDFILMDRHAGTIYNVVQSEASVYRYNPHPLTLARPIPWKIQEQVKQLPGNTRKFTLGINGKPCMEITAADKLLPDVVSALATYRQTLASVEALTWQRTPPEMRDECDLVQHVFEIRRTLQYGLPIEEVYANGRSRRYVSHGTRTLQAALFQLPPTYKMINADQLQGK
ncbi:MAG TPA: hypothetical protein VMV97_07075 [Sulfuriferula sp.]|nr:hypothetical protein [Sulfuriferula sp.]